MGRKTAIVLSGGVVAAVVCAVVVHPRAQNNPPPDPTGKRPVVSEAQYERWKTELSNWGRWGKDDQLGTLNLITPAKRKQAFALVKDYVTVSIARYWPAGGPDGDLADAKGGAIDVFNPYEISESGNHLGASIHSMAQTHLDFFDHSFVVGGRGYNGYAPDKAAVEKDGRYPRNGVESARNGIVTRGILMDIPRLKGVEWLEPGTPITAEDFEAWEKKAGLKVSAGDVLFVRTGRWARRAAVGPVLNGKPWYPGRSKNGFGAGLDPTTVLPWLKARDVAMIASDQSPYLQPPPAPYLQGAAHDFTIAVLGMPGFDVCDLEALAKESGSRKQWEFLLVASPLPLRGATGSPINPLAIF
jgi:kynurenine formamidase